MERTVSRFGTAAGALALVLAAVAPAAAAFTTGAVYFAPGDCTPPCGLFEVTGGDQQGSTPLAIIDRAPGQMAWSADLGSAYLTQYDVDTIALISASGGVTAFATGVDGPTGVLLTEGGLLLVVSYRDDTVYEANGGGDLSAAPVFADGFGAPRNLLQLDTGAILLADQGRNAVYDISEKGSFLTAPPFASGLPAGPYDLVQDGCGRIFASTDGGVYDITGGGDFLAATPHATGQLFVGLAVDGGGRLLASEFANGHIFDITDGGDYSSEAPFAANLPGFGDTALDAVPGAGSPPAQCVPALGPSGLMLLSVLLLGAAGARKTRE
jgi:DNA-binding beta-propeller fold protein YncE